MHSIIGLLLCLIDLSDILHELLLNYLLILVYNGDLPPELVLEAVGGPALGVQLRLLTEEEGRVVDVDRCYFVTLILKMN